MKYYKMTELCQMFAHSAVFIKDRLVKNGAYAPKKQDTGHGGTRFMYDGRAVECLEEVCGVKIDTTNYGQELSFPDDNNDCVIENKKPRVFSHPKHGMVFIVMHNDTTWYYLRQIQIMLKTDALPSKSNQMLYKHWESGNIINVVNMDGVLEIADVSPNNDNYDMLNWIESLSLMREKENEEVEVVDNKVASVCRPLEAESTNDELAEVNVVETRMITVGETGGFEIFNNTQFGDIRVFNVDGDPWFVAKDVATALGYERPAAAVANKVLDIDKSYTYIQTAGGRQKCIIINESGLYSLILNSHIQSARLFQHWVTSEVLPQIRKTGMYSLEDILKNPRMIGQALIDLDDQRKKNVILAEENTVLTAKNQILSAERNTWSDKKILVSIIKKHASHKNGNKYGYSYNQFYKNLEYKLGICLNKRKGDKKDTTFSKIREDELPAAMSVAIAMCEYDGVDISEILMHRAN